MKVPEPRKLPSGSYFIQLRLGGVSVPVTASTAKACKTRAERIKAEYRDGVRTVKQAAANDRTLRQLLSDYVTKYEAVLSPSTVPGYLSIIENRFPAYMDKPVKDLDFQRMINGEKKRCSPKTIKNAWGLVTAALGDAGIPVPEVKLPAVQSPTRPWLNREEIGVFLDAIHGKPMEIPALMALLSLRRSELVAVTWDNVDLDRGVIYVDGAVVRNKDNEYVYKPENKNGSSRRTVPIMIPELLDALRAVPQEARQGRVVACHPNSIYKAVNSICGRQGLPLVGVHGLRHSFASLGHSEGVPEQEMMKMGGWSDPGTMHRIYEHIEAEEITRHQNAMSSFYQSRKQKNSTE